MYVGECGTEWCRLGDGGVSAGVHSGMTGLNAVWVLLDEELGRGPGSDEEPIMIAVGGNLTPEERGDLCIWEARTPYTDLELYAGCEISAAIRDAESATGPLAEALREQGLLDADGPVRRVAAMALDMAVRSDYE